MRCVEVWFVGILGSVHLKVLQACIVSRAWVQVMHYWPCDRQQVACVLSQVQDLEVVQSEVGWIRYPPPARVV